MGQLIYGTFWGNYGDEKATSTSEVFGIPLGTRMILPDGRVFYYAFSQGAIGAGQLCMMVAGVANHDGDNAIAAAAAVGATEISVTIGSTLTTKDYYKEGYLFVNDEAGEGHMYKIRSHPAIASDGTGTFRLYDGDGIAVALTTASQVGLMANEYANAEVYDADDIDGQPIGVGVTAIADTAYCWLQTWGPCAVLQAAVLGVLGKTVVPDGTTDGAVQVSALTEATPNTGADQPIVGITMLIVPVAGESQPVDLRIRP